MAKQNENIISVDEASRLMGLSKETTAQLAKSGQLPALVTENNGVCGRIAILRKPFMELLAKGNAMQPVVYNVDIEALVRKQRILELRSRIARDTEELQELQRADMTVVSRPRRVQAKREKIA
jgi:excisionase family DNA binding protein